MKRKFLLFLSVMLVALMPLCASAGITIKLDKNLPEGWGVPQIYAWTDGVDGFWGWNECPSMTDSGDGYYTYTFADDKTKVHIIFKDANGHQTVDIKNITEDSTFQVTGSSNNYSYVLVGGPEREEKTYTVYFENTNNWGTVYAYVFGSLGNDLTGSWPGATIPSKEINGKTYYYYELTTKESIDGVQIIFNGGGDSNKTGDLKFIDKAIYNASGVIVDYIEDEEEEPEVKAPIYIIGTIAESQGEFDMSIGHPLVNIKGTNKYYTANCKVLYGEKANGAYIGLTTKLGSSSTDWDSLNGCRYKFTSNGDKYTLDASDYETTKIGEGTYYIVVDMDAKAMTAEIGDAAEINAPEALYMYGNFYDRHFDFSDPVIAVGEKLGEEDYTTYKFENILICGATEDGDTGYFILGAGVAPANNAALLAATEPERVAPENVDWTGIDGTHRYVLGENNVVTPLVANAHPTTAEYCTSTAAGNYVDLTVKLAADGSHTYEMTEHGYVATGVEAIEAEANAPVEYYNLQGVRVANPENGIFIRRQGNKVSKVAIR